MNRQRGEEFRFAADLDAEFVRRAGVHDFFHYFAQLIHFDREHAAVLALVRGLRNRGAKLLVQDADAVAQQILEPEQKRKREPAIARLFGHGHQVERGALILHGTHRHVAGVVYAEVAGAPARDVISMKRAGDIPRF